MITEKQRKDLKGSLLYLDNDIGISLEELHGCGFCHCQISKGSPSVLRRCKNITQRLLEEHKREAYAICKVKDTLHKKFLTFMGFKFENKKWISAQGSDKVVEIWRLERC